MIMQQGKGAVGLSLGQYIGSNGHLLQTLHIVSYLYILYLMDEDALLLNLCMDLPFTTTNAGQWWNNLIFPDNIS